MANEKPQNFENHTHKVPVFVFGQLVLMVNLVGRLVDLRHGISFGSVMDVLVGGALIALFVFARNSTLAVQNRLIRLEMRLRLAGRSADRFAGTHPRADFRPTHFTAIREQRRATGADAEGSRRENQRPQDDQENGEGLAGRLSAGVVEPRKEM